MRSRRGIREISAKNEQTSEGVATIQKVKKATTTTTTTAHCSSSRFRERREETMSQVTLTHSLARSHHTRYNRPNYLAAFSPLLVEEFAWFSFFRSFAPGRSNHDRPNTYILWAIDGLASKRGKLKSAMIEFFSESSTINALVLCYLQLIPFSKLYTNSPD